MRVPLEAQLITEDTDPGPAPSNLITQSNGGVPRRRKYRSTVCGFDDGGQLWGDKIWITGEFWVWTEIQDCVYFNYSP